MAQWLKNPPAMQDTEHTGSVTGSERFPGEGKGKLTPRICLGSPMERVAW